MCNSHATYAAKACRLLGCRLSPELDLYVGHDCNGHVHVSLSPEQEKLFKFAMPILLTFCQIHLPAAHAETNAPTLRDSTAKSSTMFQPPITPKDVLLNLKYALEHDLLLRREFYAQENFRWFLGEHLVVPNANNSPTEQIFTLTKEAETASNSCIESGGAQWSVWEGLAGGGVGMRVRYTDKQTDPRRPEICTQLNVDTVQAVFGKPHVVVPIFPEDGTPPPHGRNIVFGAKTHPLGHTDIKYHWSDGKISRNASFEIMGNGLVRTLGIGSSEKAGE